MTTSGSSTADGSSERPEVGPDVITGTAADVTTARPAARGTAPPSLDTWDAFVAADPLGSYLQTSAWARVKAANGWGSRRFLVGEGDDTMGAQVLIRPSRPLPWSFGYAPRGPVVRAWRPEIVPALTERLRRLGRGGRRLSHLRIDPPVERDGSLDDGGALREALAAAGWRPAPAIQPAASRVIDLTASEEALWGDLRAKWRQYVNRARRAGVRVVEAEGDRLPEFHAIYRETAGRTGLLIRTEQAYRDVWEAFRPAGMCRLLFAEDVDGTPQAALFLVRCGTRVVEPYGGMTASGAESRANYLLKWEAIRTSRERGATTYDLWGLVHAGIDHFKAGFGGREVHYIGAWDLVVDPLGERLTELAVRGRGWFVSGVRARRARTGAPAPSDGAAP